MTTPTGDQLTQQGNTNVNPVTNANPPVIIQTPPPGQYFTAEQLEAARQQEKDKLYSRMQNLEEQFKTSQAELTTYREEREAAQAAAAQAQKDADEAKRLAEEEKLTTQQLLDKRNKEWEQQQEALKRDIELERTMMQKDRELFALQNYIQRRVAEVIADNSVMPDLIEFINGNTEQEVDASVTKMQEKTANIVEGATRLTAPGQPTTTPGVSPTGFAPAGPLDTLSGTRQYTAEDIKNMNAQEYAAFRAQVGIDKAGNNKGLFN